MSGFNKGVDYAFRFIIQNLVGYEVNGNLTAAITKQQLEYLHKTIPKKCDFCTEPCEDNWCPTSETDL